MVILALDVSGSATGWAIGRKGKLEAFGKYIVDKNKQGRGEQLYHFSKWLEKLFKEKSPDLIIIERPFIGRNSNVLANISKFIAIVEMVAHRSTTFRYISRMFYPSKCSQKILKS